MTHTTKEKAPGACDSKGLTTDTNGANFRTDGAIQQAHDGKATATQLAHLALAGHIVHKGGAGDYSVCKFGMTRYCKDIAELEAFAKQVGAK